MAISNIQKQVGLAVGPQGGWSAAAWQKLKAWAESPKRARKSSNDGGLLALPAPLAPQLLALPAPPEPEPAVVPPAVEPEPALAEPVPDNPEPSSESDSDSDEQSDAAPSLAPALQEEAADKSDSDSDEQSDAASPRPRQMAYHPAVDDAGRCTCMTGQLLCKITCVVWKVFSTGPTPLV